MRLASVVLFVSVAAGCSPTDQAVPDSAWPADPAGASFAWLALQGALDRMAPTLGAGTASTELRSILTAALEQPGAVSLYTIESALERLVVQGPGGAVQADVVGLAETALH